jgi:hypothetical protein
MTASVRFVSGKNSRQGIQSQERLVNTSPSYNNVPFGVVQGLDLHRVCAEEGKRIVVPCEEKCARAQVELPVALSHRVSSLNMSSYNYKPQVCSRTPRIAKRDFYCCTI